MARIRPGFRLRRGQNLADLTDLEAARLNIGLKSAALYDDTRYTHRANNLSDVANRTTARSNLGLGSAATRNAGQSVGELMPVGAFGLGDSTAYEEKIDANNLVKTGFYKLSASAANRPPINGGYVVMVQAYSALYIRQSASLPGGGDITMVTYERWKNSNEGWTPWVKIATTANMPAVLEQAGYQALTSGLLLQWDTIYISTNGSSYNFRMAFPNAVLGVLPGTGTDTSTATAEVMNIIKSSLGRGGFTANASDAGYYTYLAIGK